MVFCYGTNVTVVAGLTQVDTISHSASKPTRFRGYKKMSKKIENRGSKKNVEKDRKSGLKKCRKRSKIGAQKMSKEVENRGSNKCRKRSKIFNLLV
jgi:hypothetical protein